MFDIELAYFIAHQDELVAKYLGKTLVLQGEAVLGVYETPLEAYVEALKQFKLGTFMIQPCEPGTEAYTVTVYSAAALVG
jgi:hypothetical protein